MAPSLFQALVGLSCLVVGTSAAAVSGTHKRDATSSPRYKPLPGTAENCIWWWNSDEGLSCDLLLMVVGISEKDFTAWNPSITSGCGNYVADNSYCIKVDKSAPIPTTTTTTTTTRGVPTTGLLPTTTTSFPGNGIQTPSPLQAGVVDNCKEFYFVEDGQSCGAVLKENGLTLEQFSEWNDVGDDCTSLWAKVWVCVAVIGGSSTEPSIPTTTRVGNGITTPSPAQPGMVDNCNKFHLVKPGETCATVATVNKITQTAFEAWNPSVGQDCAGLWANAYVCVGVVGGSPVTTQPQPVTTTITAENGIQTPQPAQPSMVSNCDRFYKVKSGDTCASIGARHGILSRRVSEWQPSVGSDCANLWVDTYVCVHTLAFQPQTNIRCGVGSTSKLWGDNKPAALDSVRLWCDGNSNTDGSGGFATGQTKSGCYKAPFGTNRIEFRSRNIFGAGASLSVASCNEFLKKTINGCDNGAVFTHEGWWFSAAVVAGQC